MPLIECPDCKKQISDQAQSCIHCGRPIKQTESPPDILPADKDYSNLKNYKAYLIDNKHDKKYLTIFAKDEGSARAALLNRNPGHTIDETQGVQGLPLSAGKYSCPSCKSKYTVCQKKIGCAIMIIIFISLGLGLIMIPFLPYHCECKICDHKWKS